MLRARPPHRPLHRHSRRTHAQRGPAIQLTDATILFVDDEPALREIFERWLKALGCRTVLLASNGSEALDVLANQRIDLLITDVRMPVMDGVSLVRNLSQQASAPPSILFVSGFGDVNHKEMYALGVEAFIAKPIDRDELMRAVESALADRCTLWTDPLPSAPRQSIRIPAPKPSEPPTLRLGRGGFSAPYDQPLALSKVAFECQLADDQRLAGQGYVRWFTRADMSVGIEFAHLDEPSRAWLRAHLEANPPRSFIPLFYPPPEPGDQ